MSQICYHGTDSQEKADSILAAGFNEYTHFSDHLESAIAFGGLWIFEVIFEDPPKSWQFVIWYRIPPERIISLKKYDVETIQENNKLRQQVFESNTKIDSPTIMTHD